MSEWQVYTHWEVTVGLKKVEKNMISGMTLFFVGKFPVKGFDVYENTQCKCPVESFDVGKGPVFIF